MALFSLQKRRDGLRVRVRGVAGVTGLKQTPWRSQGFRLGQIRELLNSFRPDRFLSGAEGRSGQELGNEQ